LYKAVSNFNVSPIGPGGLSKLLIYAFWGINALLFLGQDINFESKNFSPGVDSYTTLCTILKKIADTDLYVGNFTLLEVSPIVVILPCDYDLPLYDVITIPKDRSPPSLLFS
jgi:hypothetical protein